MSRTFDDHFSADYAGNFTRTVRIAARCGAPDPKAVAAKAWIAAYEVRAESPVGYAVTWTRLRAIDAARRRASEERALGRLYRPDDFGLVRDVRPGRGEATTGELLDTRSDPADQVWQRAVVDEIHDVSQRVAATPVPQCSMCLAHDRPCPRPDVVRQVGAVFLRRLVDEDPPALGDESSVRRLAVELGHCGPGGTNVAGPDGTAWLRGAALCASFLIHHAVVGTVAGRRGAAALVRETGLRARSRRGRARWTPLMEETMRDWCDDNYLAWPEWPAA